MADAFAYIAIHNIPQTYRSCDLRNFFSQVVEVGAFRCFHYRHRPEVQKLKGHEGVDSANPREQKQKRDTCCCLAMIKKARLEEIFNTYDKAFWVTRDGETLSTKCHIRKITIRDDPSSTTSSCFRQNRVSTLSQSDLKAMIELRPPPALPAGNVGTPTKYILKQINRCQFPVRLIGQLGLEFPRMRAKGMYGSVPFDYGRMTGTVREQADRQLTELEIDETEPSISKETFPKRKHRVLQFPAPDLSGIPTADQVTTFVRTTKGHIISNLDTQPKKILGPLESSEEPKVDDAEEELSDDGEEWDRYEALHDDVTSQERSKERLYEEGMEVVWEKGGSGLVFYTDAQHWDEAAGDFDAKTSDDWDIDMSGYYKDGAGDRDAQELISMRNSKAIRKHHSVEDENRIGFFERFTKGVGRKILEKHGWTEGKGVGVQQGIAVPIAEDGKHPCDRSGFGFRGEKLVRKRLRVSKDEIYEDRLFSTVYDRHFGQDGHGRVGRSELSTVLKYRKKFIRNSGNE